MGVEGDNNLVALQCWLKTRTHLPQNIEPLLLRRYIQSSRNDLEKAKKLLEYSFTMRNNNPQIFLQRDPSDKTTQKVMEIVDMLPLPNTTKENYKVLFYRLVEFGTENYHFTEIIKLFFMVADVRLITPDQNGLTDGEIPIFDMTGFSLRHLTKVVLSSLRCYMKYTQEAHPVRLKQIHVINCSPFLDRVLALLKPFIKSEVFKLIHFHAPGSDTLYKFVPLELLPNEYGGKAGSLKDLKKEMVEKLMSNREYLLDESRWKLQSTAKVSQKIEHEVNANFRTLSID